jgi:hypothetical protein
VHTPPVHVPDELKVRRVPPMQVAGGGVLQGNVCDGYVVHEPLLQVPGDE